MKVRIIQTVNMKIKQKPQSMNLAAGCKGILYTGYNTVSTIYI